MPIATKDFDESIPIEGDLAVCGLVDMEPGYRGSFTEPAHGVTDTYRHCYAPFVDLRIGGRTFRFDLTLRHVVLGAKEEHMNRERELGLLSDCLGDEVEQNCGEKLREEFEKSLGV